MSAEYRPWTTIECGRVPVPWARDMGVPVDFVELPGPVAAATAEDVIGTAQAVAFIRVCQAQAAIQEMQQAQAQRSVSGRIKLAQEAHYEPPLARMVCPVCGDTANAWINDDGTLQDPRDVICGKTHAPEAMIQLRDGTA